jgi:DNA repair photolyase
MKIREIEAKSVLVQSKLPDTDYVVNPYVGCQFGCQYCYASFMGRFNGETVGEWGNYVYAKVNAPELLAKELSRWSPDRRRSTLFMSSVTDPYHGIEAKYRLTERILKILADAQYPGRVGILTKSMLVTRDIAILSSLLRCEVGMTITTTDDQLSRFLEVRAPSSSRRLRALEQLASAGLTTYAFVGPLLPHFRYKPELLDSLFASLARVGVRSLYVEHINLKRYIKERLWGALATEPDEVRAIYRGARDQEHRSALESLVSDLAARHRLELRLSRVLDHSDDSVVPLSRARRK